MKIKNQVTIALSVILLSISAAITLEWAWYCKARCYLIKDDIDKALENLEKAIELNPDKLRQISRNDGDWDVIRDSNRFKNLIDE